MIQPQELRIGSLLSVEGKIIKVGRIDENLISWNIAKDTAKFKIWNPYLPISDKRIQPIPLTEEILLKFGFEKQHNENDFDYWFKKGFCDDILWEHSDGFCHSLNYGGDIKYVHQLQNLYFALTGEDLY